MSRNNRTQNRARAGLAKLFLWTALMGILCGLGLVAGQRFFLDEDRPPLISVSSATPDLSSTQKLDPTLESDERERPSLFSFYEALTTPEPSSDDQRQRQEAASPTPSSPEPTSEASLLDSRIDTSSESEPKPESDDPPSHADPSEDPARYTLQIASHPSIERARSEMDHLKTLGLTPHIVATDVPGQGKYYQIRLGKFPTIEDARSHQQHVQQQQDIQGFITPL